MKKLTQKLCLISIFLSSTQIIVLPHISMSIFQLSLIITMIMSFLCLYTQRVVRLEKMNIVLMVLWAISSIVAFSLSEYPSIAKSYLLVGLMTAYFVVCIPLFFSINDIDRLERALIRSQYITIVLSAYSFYLFYYGGGFGSSIMLPFGMHIAMDKDFILRIQASGQIRLALPYATPPVLSGVMSICITILLVNKSLYPKAIRYSLIGIYSLILLYTGSRTGYVSMLFFLVFFVIKYGGKKATKNRQMLVFGSIILFLISFVYLWINSSYFKLFVGRLNLKTLLQDRHIQLIFDGFSIWTESVRNFVLGIGFLNGMNYTYMKSGGAPYFFNFFVTTIAERGILGICMVSILVLYAFKAIKQIRQSEEYRMNSIAWAYMIALVSALFYEMLSCYYVIIIIGIFCMTSTKHKVNIINKNIHTYELEERA